MSLNIILITFIMKFLFRMFILLFALNVSSQDMQKDTIPLKEILVDKSAKKPKIKKIKYGKHTQTYLLQDLFFTDDAVFYLTDSLPDGQIQQINLFFSQIALKPKFGSRDYKTLKVNKTEFEATIYEVNDDYSVGDKVNSIPIPIVLEESSDGDIEKVELNLAQYNFRVSRFYIYLKKITNTTCEECYYYAPVLYKTGDKYHYITEKRKDIYKKQKSDYACFGLQIDVETLTSYY